MGHGGGMLVLLNFETVVYFSKINRKINKKIQKVDKIIIIQNYIRAPY
jgi:hypothetical protein